MGAHMAGYTEDGDGAVEGKRDRLRFVQLFAIWCAGPKCSACATERVRGFACTACTRAAAVFWWTLASRAAHTDLCTRVGSLSISSEAVQITIPYVIGGAV